MSLAPARSAAISIVASPRNFAIPKSKVFMVHSLYSKLILKVQNICLTWLEDYPFLEYPTSSTHHVKISNTEVFHFVVSKLTVDSPDASAAVKASTGIA